MTDRREYLRDYMKKWHRDNPDYVKKANEAYRMRNKSLVKTEVVAIRKKAERIKIDESAVFTWDLANEVL